MEVLLNMTKRMNRKMMTSLPTLRIGLTSMIRLGGAGLERMVRQVRTATTRPANPTSRWGKGEISADETAAV